jgi:hypothetical protein
LFVLPVLTLLDSKTSGTDSGGRDVIAYFGRSAIAMKFGAAVGAAFLILVFGNSPSFAFPVTDIFGNTCDTSQLVGGGPGGISICPASLTFIKNQFTQYHKIPFLQPLDNDPGLTPTPYFGWMHPGDSSNPTVTIGVTPYEVLWAPAPGYLGGPVTVGLHGSDSSNGYYSGGGIASTHNTGYSVSDSLGTIAPNSLAPGFNSLTYGTGLDTTFDGSRVVGLVGSNQKLIFGLAFDYNHEQTNFGTSALTPGVANVASTNADIYTIKGSVLYSDSTFYLGGSASFDWMRTGVNVQGAMGATDGVGYAVNGTVGKLFPLFGNVPTNTTTITKAAPKPITGYAYFLDVSGHAGYVNERDNSFTDSTGFITGPEQLSYTDVGAQARLVAILPVGGLSWEPYVGFSIDQQLGFNHTLDFPTQAATAADIINFGQSNTFWGVQSGLALLGRGGMTVGMNAFFQASGDTNTIGGNLVFKIPLWQPPAADSGIRVATGK